MKLNQSQTIFLMTENANGNACKNSKYLKTIADT